MREVLREILLRADTRDASCFDADEVERWPAGALNRLQKLGLLREAEPASGVVCRECEDDCWIEPAIRDAPCAGKPIGVYFCRRNEEVGRFTVDLARRWRWSLSASGLAAWVAGLAGLKGKPKEVVAGRLWRLGRTPWPPGSQRTRGVVFARRMQEDDAASVAAHVGPAGRAVVLVPYHVPDERVWSGTVPAVIPLSQVVTWSDGGPVLDAMAVLETIKAADALAERARAVSLEARGQKAVRRQVKAEIKSLLTDDAYNAYARGIVSTLANDCVGTGPRLQLLSEDAESNRRVEAAFGQWARAVD
ncbi:MAG: hypothetical protein KGY99_11455, partial [Phycisphaerae bacterium]|nr:hypothetical protein [Phycisphaerae bacterium]